MIEETINIAIIISKQFFEIINNFNSKDYIIEKHSEDKTIFIIKTLSINFYKKYESIMKSDEETWIHIFQNEGVHNYYGLVIQYAKKELLDNYNIDVSK